MPGATPRYSLSYPVLGDPPHGPNQILDLAQDVEAALGVVDDFARRTPVGGEYKAAALQALGATGATRLTFGTAVKAANGITYNGTNTFTTLEAGVYSGMGSCKVPFAAANSFGMSLGPSAAYIGGDGMYVPENFSYNTTDVAVSGTFWLDVGATVSVWIYNNGGAVNSNFSGRPALFRLWKVA